MVLFLPRAKGHLKNKQARKQANEITDMQVLFCIVSQDYLRDSQCMQPITVLGYLSGVEGLSFLLTIPCTSEAGPRDPSDGTDLNASSLRISFMV